MKATDSPQVHSMLLVAAAVLRGFMGQVKTTDSSFGGSNEVHSMILFAAAIFEFLRVK